MLSARLPSLFFFSDEGLRRMLALQVPGWCKKKKQSELLLPPLSSFRADRFIYIYMYMYLATFLSIYR